MRVIFFGTPPFAAEVLKHLLTNHIEIVAVISKPDRPKGRSGTPVPTPVKVAALNFNPNLPVYQPEIVSAPEFADVLKAYQADLFVVVAYGEIIKQHLLDMPRLGCINLHVSLLPKYRGAAPIQRAIIAGEHETGVTVMHMVKKMDAGDMIEVAKLTIDPDVTFGELEKQLIILGKKTLLKVLRDFEQGIIKRIPQDHSLATLAPKIELEDCEVNWDQKAEVIHNLIRGVNPYPGAWCYVTIRNEKKRLKLLRSKLVLLTGTYPGCLLNKSNENIIVSAADQALELVEVQLEGKKVMLSSQLYQGAPDISFIL